MESPTVSVIIAFVLAIAVPIVVGLALLTYGMVISARLTLAVSELNARMKACETGLAKTSASGLAAELADLRGDHESLAKSVRKNLGRLYQQRVREREPDPEPETPEQVRARLRASHGLPKMGAPPNGAASAEE